MFSLFYFLISDKKESSYVKVFLKLKILFSLNPEIIICDFERGIVNSLNKNFQNSATNGCLLHFGQAIWKRIQVSGFSNEYLRNPDLKKSIEMVLNLAFVPTFHINVFYSRILNWISSKGLDIIKMIF